MNTQEYERAVIFRLGRVKKGGAVGPGLFTILPCIDNIVTVDLRTVTFDVPPQEILSRDSVTVTVDAVIYYRVSNPTMVRIFIWHAGTCCFVHPCIDDDGFRTIKAHPHI